MAIIKHMMTLYNTLFYLAFNCRINQLSVKRNTIIVFRMLSLYRKQIALK